MLDHRSSRNYGQGGGYRNDYDYQNRGQRYDQYYYDGRQSRGTRGQGDQHYYHDDSYYDSRSGYGSKNSRRGSDNYYDSRSGYGGSNHRGSDNSHDSRSGYDSISHRGRDNDHDNKQRGEGDYRSRYTYRADEQRSQPNTYNTTHNAPSADQPQTTNDIL